MRGPAGAFGTAAGVIASPGTAIAPAAGQGDHGQPKRHFLIATWAPGTGIEDFVVSVAIEAGKPGAAGAGGGRMTGCCAWSVGREVAGGGGTGRGGP